MSKRRVESLSLPESTGRAAGGLGAPQKIAYRSALARSQWADHYVEHEADSKPATLC
jgi:hypothetical protein